MKFLLPAIISILLINTSNAQLSFAGEYRMTQMGNDSVPHNMILKLNCNGTYIRSDSIQIAYGKWKSKNGDLILLADSATVNNKTDIVNYKLVYKNIDNKFHIKYVPKEEYLEMLALIRKSYPNLGNPEGGYQKYKDDAQTPYYEKIIEYNCK